MFVIIQALSTTLSHVFGPHFLGDTVMPLPAILMKGAWIIAKKPAIVAIGAVATYVVAFVAGRKSK